MASERVAVGQWTWCIPERLRFYLADDPLMDADYRPTVDFGIFEHTPGWLMLETRTRADMPAGWRQQFVFPQRLYLPGVEARLNPVDTNEFQLSPVERFEHRRTIR
jgi:hypothetical protein